MAQNVPVLPPQQNDPLAQLRDIHVPAPIDMWPLAPGWWILVAFAVLLVVAILGWLYARWRRNQYRRDALAELDRLRTRYESAPDNVAYIADYSTLLKRVALRSYRRDAVASLSGESWVQFLDHAARTDEFSMGAGQALIAGSYEREPEVDVDRLHELGRYWIREHRKLEQTA
ncbi:MAG: DUF4381 domain-containing protein [Pseudomonadales bacterium]|nr:DUF4381 domain-containing protein [Pseudomonadales bacterium]